MSMSTILSDQFRYDSEILPNSKSTFNVLFKKIEERYEVLKKICSPEDVDKILTDTVDWLTAVIYEKMAQQLLHLPSSSVYSLNTRPSSQYVASNFGSSVSSIPDQPSESNRRWIDTTATSRNRCGLLKVPISDCPRPRPLQFTYSSQFSRANDVHKVELPGKPHLNTAASICSKKSVLATDDRTEKGNPVPGLSVPVSLRPVPPSTQSGYPSKNPMSPEIKEHGFAPANSDENNSWSVFFKKRPNAAAKQSASRMMKQNSQNRKGLRVANRSNVSVSTQNRVSSVKNTSESKAEPSGKRKAFQNDDDITMTFSSRKKSPVAKETDSCSPDTTTSNDIIERNPTKYITNNEIVQTREQLNNSLSAAKKSAKKSKKNKENKEKPKATSAIKSRSQKKMKTSKANVIPVAAEDIEMNPAGGEMFNDESFFGDVSSIESDSVVMLANATPKNLTKHSIETRNEMLQHFVSPVTNIRSTSGFSAISTPLSKSASKIRTNSVGQFLLN